MHRPEALNTIEVATMAIPAQGHLFVDNSFKEETHSDNGANLINRFDVICRFCLNENERLLDIFGPIDCVVVMTQSLVDVKIEADDKLPKQICTNCYELLNQCLTFRHQIVSSDIALRRCIDQLQQVEIHLKQGVDASVPGITKHHTFYALSTANELADGHKFEDLIDDEYTPGDELVSEKDSNLYSDYDGAPVRDDDDRVDFSLKVKREPIMSASDAIESLPNLQRKSQTSDKCNSTLQRQVKSHYLEQLKYQCKVCSKSFSRQAGLKGHLSSHQKPNDDTEEQPNVFKCTKSIASVAVEPDVYIHASVNSDNLKICDKNLSRLTKLRRHLKAHYEEKPFKCEQCGRGFTRKMSLMRHYRVHTKMPRGGKHLCKECGKCYFDSYALSVHYRKHTGEKPYKCSHCSKALQTSSALAIHVRICSGESPYKCSHCSKSLGSSASLASHVRTHTGERPFKCSHCSKSFGKSSTLAYHVRSHTGEKPYKCPHCSNTFVYSSSLAIHVRTHTGEKPFKCSHCSKTFGRSSALAIHVRTHTGEKPYKCPHCSKAFGNSSALALHVRKHTGEKPCKCQHCSKTFGCSSALATHVRTHTGEKPYKCSHCSKAFGNSSALTMHVRTHTGEKPFKCSHCPKTFGRSSALAVHVRTHTGEKPFKCLHCSKAFGNSSSLALHVRTHTGEKPCKCPHCSKTYRTLSALSMHVRTHMCG